MRVLIVPDSFKGTMDAEAVAEAIARGVRAELGDAASCVVVPASDGGEGFARLVSRASALTWREAEVEGPMGTAVRAGFGMGAAPGDRRRTLAVLDAASAIGLSFVPENERDPTRATSRGVGELLLAAIDSGADEAMLGVGGVATVDGGIGMLHALGVRCFGDGGEIRGPGPADLANVRRLVVPEDAPIRRFGERVNLTVAVDVSSPLLGPDGAAAIYGPQKGATAAQVRDLEAGLSAFARVAARDGLATPIADGPGMGAAGGLPFALAAFAGATIEPGFGVFATATGLDRTLADADSVITGEGAFDATSFRGKVVGELALRAASVGRPTAVIAGRVAERWRDEAPAPLVCEAFRAGTEDGLADAASIERQAREATRWLRTAINARRTTGRR